MAKPLITRVDLSLDALSQLARDVLAWIFLVLLLACVVSGLFMKGTAQLVQQDLRKKTVKQPHLERYLP